MTHPAKSQLTFKQRAKSVLMTKSVAIAKSIHIPSFQFNEQSIAAMPIRLLAYSLAKHAKIVQAGVFKTAAVFGRLCLAKCPTVCDQQDAALCSTSQNEFASSVSVGRCRSAR